MKFWKISELLKFRDIKLNKRRTYNNLYNDFTIRNNKKENIRMNQLYNESELYSFTPLINHSGYMTYRTNNNRNLTPYINKNSFYKKNNYPNLPLNQKYSNYSSPYAMGRNLLTENSKVDNRNYNDYDYDNYINNNNDNYLTNDYFLTNRNNLKRNNLNRTDYGFYSPTNKKRKKGKNIYSNNNDDINSKISEYLNNFENNQKRIDMLNPNNNTYSNYNTYSSKKRNKSISNANKGNIYDNLYPGKSNNNLYNAKYKNNGELENYFNQKSSNNKNIFNPNLKLNNERLNFSKNKNNKNNNKNNNKSILKYNNNNQNDDEDKNSKNSKKIYNDSKDYFYSFNKENNNINNNNNKDLSKKNSNTSLNPSSYGVDHMKTYYTNKQKTSNNNVNIGTSNINSASSRMLDTQYHFLNGLKMMSGEVNEYFYDFNSGRKGNKDKNDDQRSVQSLQSLSDSKMMELANHYLSEEDNSEENYQMNNIIYHRKKHNVK